MLYNKEGISSTSQGGVAKHDLEIKVLCYGCFEASGPAFWLPERQCLFAWILPTES